MLKIIRHYTRLYINLPYQILSTNCRLIKLIDFFLDLGLLCNGDEWKQNRKRKPFFYCALIYPYFPPVFISVDLIINIVIWFTLALLLVRRYYRSYSPCPQQLNNFYLLPFMINKALRRKTVISVPHPLMFSLTASHFLNVIVVINSSWFQHLSLFIYLSIVFVQ